MEKNEEYPLSEGEKNKYRKYWLKSKAVLDFIKEERLDDKFFKEGAIIESSVVLEELTALSTIDLVDHSITLTRLTRRLNWLTIVLLSIAFVNIFLILGSVSNWF